MWETSIRWQGVKARTQPYPVWGTPHPLDDTRCRVSAPLRPSRCETTWKETASSEDPCPEHVLATGPCDGLCRAAACCGCGGGRPTGRGKPSSAPGPLAQAGPHVWAGGRSLGTGGGDSPSLSRVPTPEGGPLGGARRRSLSFSFLFSIVGFVFVSSGPRVPNTQRVIPAILHLSWCPDQFRFKVALRANTVTLRCLFTQNGSKWKIKSAVTGGETSA